MGKKLLLFIVVLLFASHVKSENIQTVRLVTSQDVYRDYLSFLQKRSPLSISQYHGEYSRRDVIELVLIQQILNLGGYSGNITIVTAPSYARLLKLLKSSAVDISGSSVWNEDIQSNQLLSTQCVICSGEFEAGFYTTPDNPVLLSSITDLSELRVASSKHWKADWKRLSQLKTKQLVSVNNWERMVALLEQHRVDAVLAPFQPSKDMRFKLSPSRYLLPIPNIKVSLDDTRHFALSKNARHLQTIVNKGIEVLKHKGILRKAYEESGFYNASVKTWQQIKE